MTIKTAPMDHNRTDPLSAEDAAWQMTHQIRDFYRQGFAALKPAHPDAWGATYEYIHDCGPAVRLSCRFVQPGQVTVKFAMPSPHQPEVIETLCWNIDDTGVEYLGPQALRQGIEPGLYTPFGREQRLAAGMNDLHSLFAVQKDVLLQPPEELFRKKKSRSVFDCFLTRPL